MEIPDAGSQGPRFDPCKHAQLLPQCEKVIDQ
jgi:hypothetical protein